MTLKFCLLISVTIIMGVTTSCAPTRKYSGECYIPPDSVVFEACMMPIRLHTMCSAGPSGSILVRTSGDIFKFSPPEWQAEELQLELPFSNRLVRNQASAFYSDTFKCYYFLIGNGLFRLPRDRTEADRHMIITRPYSNRAYSDLLPIRDGRLLIINCRISNRSGGYLTKLLLVDTEDFLPLDTLYYDSPVRHMIAGPEEAELYLRESTGSIAVVDINSFVIDRTFEFEPGIGQIGFAANSLLGFRSDTLYQIDRWSGVLNPLWGLGEDCNRSRYEWRFAYPWGPYVFRADWEDSVLETIKLPDISVVDRHVMDLSRIPELDILFISPHEGFVFNKTWEGYYRLVR